MENPFIKGSAYLVFLPDVNSFNTVIDLVSNRYNNEPYALQDTNLDSFRNELESQEASYINGILSNAHIKDLLQDIPTKELQDLTYWKIKCINIIHLSLEYNIILSDLIGLDLLGTESFIKFIKHVSKQYRDKIFILFEHPSVRYSIKKCNIYNLEGITDEKIDTVFRDNIIEEQDDFFKLKIR